MTMGGAPRTREDGADRVRVGLTLPSFQSDPERVLAVARAAEDAGLDGVFLFDHLFRRRGDGPGAERRPALELLTMTAAVAAATRTITVGTLVARATLRPPAALRSAFDTLARVAPGRIIAGLGAGDDESVAEDVAFGVVAPGPETGPGTSGAPARPSPGEGPAAGPDGADPAGARGWRRELGRYRVARLEETVVALRGRGYPVWVAGSSPAARRLAAGSDGWNLWGGEPDRFAVAARGVRRQVAAAGSDPARFSSTWGGLAVLAATAAEAQDKWDRLGRNRSGIVWGHPARVAEQIAAYAAAGADWVVLGPIDSSNADNAAVLGGAVRLLASPLGR